MIKLLMGENDGGQRLDRFLKKYFRNASLSHIYRLIRKDIKVNGKRKPQDHILKTGDEITVYITEEEEQKLRGDQLERKAQKTFKICYEDDELLIVNKPYGLLTHGTAVEKKNTLANQVIGYLVEQGGFDPESEKIFSPAPLNRLDRNTTGLVMFGKTAAATRKYNDMLAGKGSGTGCIEKYYLAILSGCLQDEITIDNDLSGKEALTIIKPKKKTKDFTLAEVKLITGRTHQIRIHAAAAGHPIAGDPKYADRRANKLIKERYDFTGQLLHAWRLVIEGRKITADPPRHFERIEKDLFNGR